MEAKSTNPSTQDAAPWGCKSEASLEYKVSSPFKRGNEIEGKGGGRDKWGGENFRIEVLDQELQSHRPRGPQQLTGKPSVTLP